MKTILKVKWMGGIERHFEGDVGLCRELWWLIRHGKFRACWQWPELVFGAGRVWYDGPGWYVHFGFFSVDLWSD